jgi:hypothetical protein
MNRLIRAFATWNPAMWAGYSAGSAAMACSETWLAYPGAALFAALMLAALAVTFKGDAP